MDAEGVDGAVLVSPCAMYRCDASYVLNGYAAHPGRFALVKPVGPGNPAVAETVAKWAATKGTVGILLFLLPAVPADPTETGLNRVLAVAARHSMPVNMASPGAHGMVAKTTLAAHLVVALAGNAGSAPTYHNAQRAAQGPIGPRLKYQAARIVA
jgi:L-fuconolactonase